MTAAPAPWRAHYLRLAVIAGLVLLADQLTKAAVLAALPLHDSREVIAGFFSLTHIQNPGGAFGLLADQHPLLRRVVFLGVSAVAVGIVLWFYHRTPADRPWLAAAFALIFGGAIGNLVDRIRFGRVVDFLDFYVGRLHWPAFNVADSAITVGVGIFLLHLALGRLPD